MEQYHYEQALKQKIAPKFRGQDMLASKVAPRYPASVEREYLRFIREFMVEFDQLLRSRMPALRASLEASQRLNLDAVPNPAGSASKSPDEILGEIERAWDKKLLSWEVRSRLERIAHMNRKLTVAEWNRVLQKTLGISVFEDYYSGEFFKETIPTWVFENVELIITQPKDILGRMREIVQESFTQGRRVELISRDINEAYGIGKRHAMLIARDQTAKLNADITQKQMQDAGVEMYIWDTSRDQRVRESHRKMHGLYCRYDDVNVYSRDGNGWFPKTPGMAIIKGQFVQVGKDYQCRCTGRAVFTLAGFTNVPVAAVDWKAVDQRYIDRMEAMNQK